MLFQFTAVELGRFEDVLYWLRRAGFVVDVHYTQEDATIDAVKGSTEIHMTYRRYGTLKLSTTATVSRNGVSEDLARPAIQVISIAKTDLDLGEDEDEDEGRDED